jgi:hypothetical protein
VKRIVLLLALLAAALASDAAGRENGSLPTWAPGRIGNVVIGWRIPKGAAVRPYGKAFRFTIRYRGAAIEGLAGADRRVVDATSSSSRLSYRAVRVGTTVTAARARLGARWRLFDLRNDPTCPTGCFHLQLNFGLSTSVLDVDAATRRVTSIEVSRTGD